jgi:hypothetical protein
MVFDMSLRLNLTRGEVVVRGLLSSRRIPLTQVVEAHPSGKGVEISTTDGHFIGADVPDAMRRAELAEAINKAAAEAVAASAASAANSDGQSAVAPRLAGAPVSNTGPAGNIGPARIIGYCLGPGLLIASFVVPGALAAFRTLAVLLTVATVTGVVAQVRKRDSELVGAVVVVRVLPGALAD